VFSGCTSLSGLQLPGSIASIGASAFQNCANLAELYLPDGIASIGGNAFQGCVSLASMTIPASVEAIGDGAFSGWTLTQEINIEGYADETEADEAWGTGWRDNCGAEINYSET